MTTTVSRPRGPYAKTAEVRRRIIDACMQVFASAGYRATTMKEVAERAGISQRGLVHHFATKEDLLTAVLERREAENSEQVANVPGLALLFSMVDVVASDADRPGLVELHVTLAAEASASDHPAHEHYRERYDVFRDAATQCFAALREAGELDSPLTDADLGAAYVALSDGLQLQWLYNREAVDSAAVLSRFLRSLLLRPATTG